MNLSLVEQFKAAVATVFDERVKSLTESTSAKDTEISTLRARVAELEGAATTAGENHASALAAKDTEIKTLRDQVAAKDGEIATLKSEAKTGARQAANILANAGVDTKAATGTGSTGDKTFAQIVREQVAAGKSKGAALQWAIAEFPDQYKAAKADGSLKELAKI